MTGAESILKNVFGHERFRETQAEIVQAIMDGRDVLAVLPTGGGKSICFQVPTLLKGGLCIVVTPLIALMQDQVDQLKRRKIRAVAVHSGMGYEEIDITLDNCIYASEENGVVKFLYLSPERIQTEIFRERVGAMNVSLIAVDEAHCISQWGYDFRPPYLLLSDLRTMKPGVAMLALTASATPPVQKDIMEKLSFKKPAIFVRSFARPGLSLVVRKTEAKDKKLLEVLRKVKGSAIVYVRKRKLAVEVAKLLLRNGITASWYHAGLSYGERTDHQREWQTDRVRVMVATNAFGMGIDKPDVRTVVHMDLPENLESYYQEAGRAGRDGKRAYAAVLYADADIEQLRSNVLSAQPAPEYLKRVYQAISNLLQLAEGSAEGQSYDFDFDNFCRRYNLKPSSVYPALKILEESNLIVLSDGFHRPSSIHIPVDKKVLYEFQIVHERYDQLVKAVLRLYGAEPFSGFVMIAEKRLSEYMKVGEGEVRKLLLQLSKQKIISYEPTSDSPRLTFTAPRQDADLLPIDWKKRKERQELATSRMESVVSFVTGARKCRMQRLQEYFGEEGAVECGICDVCITRKKKEHLKTLSDYRQQVLHLLKVRMLTVDELEMEIEPSEKDLFIDLIRDMVDEGTIAYDEVWRLSPKIN